MAPRSYYAYSLRGTCRGGRGQIIPRWTPSLACSSRPLPWTRAIAYAIRGHPPQLIPCRVRAPSGCYREPLQRRRAPPAHVAGVVLCAHGIHPLAASLSGPAPAGAPTPKLGCSRARYSSSGRSPRAVLRWRAALASWACITISVYGWPIVH